MQAIHLYEKGIEELKKGMSVDCSSCKGEALERALRLQNKMKTNLKMAQERLNFLASANNAVTSHRRSNSLTMPITRRSAFRRESPVGSPSNQPKISALNTPPTFKKPVSLFSELVTNAISILEVLFSRLTP